MEPAKVAKPSKGFRKLIARPFKRGAPSKVGRVEGPISPIPFNFNPPAPEERAPKQKAKSRGTLLKLLQKAISCITSTRKAMEEDSVSDYGDVIDISPGFIERAQESDARVIEAATVIAQEVNSIALERTLPQAPIDEPSIFNPKPALFNNDVGPISKSKPSLAQNHNHTDVDVPSEQVAFYDAVPFGEGGDSFYAEELMNVTSSIKHVNDLSFYFSGCNRTSSAGNLITGLNHTAVHRLLPFNNKNLGSTKKTLSESKPSAIIAHKKAGPPRDYSVASSEQRDSTVASESLAPKKRSSISKHVVKLSTVPRYTMDSNGEPVRRPKGKARIQRLYYIHDPTLPMIEEEDIADLVVELVEEESPESSASVADSVSVYSQESYVSHTESISSPELANNVVVDSEVHDVGERHEEGEEENGKVSFVVEDDDEDDNDGDNVLFSEVSATIARSRVRRQGVYGKGQLYARTYAAPVLAIVKDRQEVNQYRSSRTGLRPLLLPISVSLRDDLGNAND